MSEPLSTKQLYTLFVQLATMTSPRPAMMNSRSCPPELFRGKSYPASDQYALAIVVYEWLSGGPPFYEEDFIQLGYQHTYVPPVPLSVKTPSISREVESIVNIA